VPPAAYKEWNRDFFVDLAHVTVGVDDPSLALVHGCLRGELPADLLAWSLPACQRIYRAPD
jgi:hypothetical protein